MPVQGAPLMASNRRPPFPSVVVPLKGPGGHQEGTFETVGGSRPYLWVGNDDGCFVAVSDLRTLRKMKAVLDGIVEARSR